MPQNYIKNTSEYTYRPRIAVKNMKEWNDRH